MFLMRRFLRAIDLNFPGVLFVFLFILQHGILTFWPGHFPYCAKFTPKWINEFFFLFVILKRSKKQYKGGANEI